MALGLTTRDQAILTAIIPLLPQAYPFKQADRDLALPVMFASRVFLDERVTGTTERTLRRSMGHLAVENLIEPSSHTANGPLALRRSDRGALVPRHEAGVRLRHGATTRCARSSSNVPSAKPEDLRLLRS